MKSERQYQFIDGAWLDVWNDNKPVEGFMPGDVVPTMIATQDFCGCGDPDRIAEAMRKYLTSGESVAPSTYGLLGLRPPSDPVKILHFDYEDLAQLLIAYIADSLGLTEHGSVITSSWVTEAGEAWLRLPTEVTT